MGLKREQVLTTYEGKKEKPKKKNRDAPLQAYLRGKKKESRKEGRKGEPKEHGRRRGNNSLNKNKKKKRGKDREAPARRNIWRIERRRDEETQQRREMVSGDEANANEREK